MKRLLVLTLGIWCAGSALAAEGTVKKVLVIGIDGCRPDAIVAAHTPHHDKLSERGTYCVDAQILAPRETQGDTVSGPGWSNILTGVWPDKHGVIDNSFRGSNYGDYPHFFTRIKQVRPEAVTGSFSDWGPIKDKILSGADVASAFPEGGAKGLEEYLIGDVQAADACAKFIADKDPTAVMIYLGQVDESGHRHGFHPKVPQYVTAIETVDGLIGKLIAAVESRPKFDQEDWLVVVCTDHGGVGLGHGGGRKTPEIRDVFLIFSGPSVIQQRTEEPSYQVDVVATALTHLGIKLDPAWKLDGKAIGLK
jgi:predicted AlkP superfamily pyrophosphatase or phosphodiesterase